MDPLSKDEEDLRLVRLVLGGNAEAYGALVRRYEKSVYRFCLSYTKSPEEAEDAAQEVFLRAYVSLKTFSIDRSFKTWLFTIAANHLRSRWRRTKAYMEKLKRAFVSRIADAEDDPGQDAERNLAREGVRRAIDDLPENLRSSVYLYYLEGLSVDETGKALGLGEEAVKSRLFRARKLLRRMLEDLGGVE